MVVKRLSDSEAVGGFNVLVELTHADLTDADTQQTIALFNVAPGDLVVRCASKLVIPFEDTADAALLLTTIIVGDGGSTARYLASQELNLNGTEIDFKSGTIATQSYAYLVADTVDAIIDVTAAKTCLQLDAGKLHLFFQVVKLNTLSDPIV